MKKLTDNINQALVDFLIFDFFLIDQYCAFVAYNPITKRSILIEQDDTSESNGSTISFKCDDNKSADVKQAAVTLFKAFRRIETRRDTKGDYFFEQSDVHQDSPSLFAFVMNGLATGAIETMPTSMAELFHRDMQKLVCGLRLSSALHDFNVDLAQALIDDFGPAIAIDAVEYLFDKRHLFAEKVKPIAKPAHIDWGNW